MPVVAGALASKNLPANVAMLLERVLEGSPLHKNFVRNALAHMTKLELAQLNGYLDYCLDCGKEIDFLAQCYLTILEDTIAEQRYFSEHRKYRHTTFSEVADSVYFNNEYMHRYMFGLALSSFLWPNHLEMARFFSETLPRNKRGRYLEVGPGHGYYLANAMRNSAFDQFLGVDISEASIKQTRDIVHYFNPQAEAALELRLADFLDAEQLKEHGFDAIVMGEVLEHVERPEAFLKRIVQLAKQDAYIFVTTCINAPAIDHIYLWRDLDDLEGLFSECGLLIKQALRLPHEGKTLAECISSGLAINVAYVLETS